MYLMASRGATCSSSMLLTLDVFQCDVWRALVLADVVHGHDVWMAELRRSPRLEDKALQRRLVPQCTGSDHLERDLAAEPAIPRETDRNH